MKKTILAGILLTVLLTGCNTPENLVSMTSYSANGASENNIIEWDGVQYYAFGIDAGSLIGEQIGIVDGDNKHRVYAVKGYSSNEWIIEKHQGGDRDDVMLYKEKSVEEIPADLDKYEYKDVYLTLPQSEFSLKAETIPFTIINELRDDIAITLIPRLECIENGRETEVPFADAGFCGTPDTISDRYDGEVMMSWWGDNLTAGVYQLSYTLYDSGIVISQQFELK